MIFKRGRSRIRTNAREELTVGEKLEVRRDDEREDLEGEGEGREEMGEKKSERSFRTRGRTARMFLGCKK